MIIGWCFPTGQPNCNLTAALVQDGHAKLTLSKAVRPATACKAQLQAGEVGQGRQPAGIDGCGQVQVAQGAAQRSHGLDRMPLHSIELSAQIHCAAGAIELISSSLAAIAVGQRAASAAAQPCSTHPAKLHPPGPSSSPQQQPADCLQGAGQCSLTRPRSQGPGPSQCRQMAAADKTASWPGWPGRRRGRPHGRVASGLGAHVCGGRRVDKSRSVL